MKRTRCYLPLLCLMLLSLPVIHAQSAIDVNVGGGSFHANSLGSIDPNTFLPCNSVSTACVQTPGLGSFFLGFGANLMLWKKFGIGGEAALQPARQDYVTITQGSAGTGYSDVVQTRTTFYDFNGIFQPVATKKAALQLSGGIGGANVKFYEHISGSNSILGNTNQTQFFGSSNHFQMHAGVGIQIYLTEHVFVRPEFDYHYVHNFTQYGQNSVPGGMIWVGYTLGDRP